VSGTLPKGNRTARQTQPNSPTCPLVGVYRPWRSPLAGGRLEELAAHASNDATGGSDLGDPSSSAQPLRNVIRAENRGLMGRFRGTPNYKILTRPDIRIKRLGLRLSGGLTYVIASSAFAVGPGRLVSASRPQVDYFAPGSKQ